MEQQYLPDELVGTRYYIPSGHGQDKGADKNNTIRNLSYTAKICRNYLCRNLAFFLLIVYTIPIL